MRGGVRRVVAVLLVAGAALVAAPATLAARATPAATATKVTVVGMGGNCTSFFCFQPAAVRIAHNSKVTWLNHSGVTHTITRCTPAACSGHGGGTGTDAGFGTSSLGSAQRYGFTFHAAGTYVYYCAIHGYAVMHGTVTVH